MMGRFGSFRVHPLSFGHLPPAGDMVQFLILGTTGHFIFDSKTSRLIKIFVPSRHIVTFVPFSLLRSSDLNQLAPIEVV